MPSRFIMHGTEGVGKSTIGANAPSPIFAMTRGETGLLTLIDSGLVGETDHFGGDSGIQTWGDLLAAVYWLLSNPRDNKTFVLDTLNGAERLCFEHVTREKYRGDWESFMAFGRGPEVAQAEWLKLLEMLDRLRAERKMGILLLCHTRVKTFRNPEGDDYDRYTPDMHDKLWSLTHKWADAVLFANFQTFAKREKNASRAKGFGGDERVIYTRRTAAWDAKNRLGLPEEISMGRKPEDGWRALAAALRAARAAATAAQTHTSNDDVSPSTPLEE